MSAEIDERLDDIEERKNKDIDEMTEEGYKQFDGNLADALLKASDFKNELEAEMKIVRNKVLLFQFKIHPLSEADYNRIREKNIKHRGKKDEKLDLVRYRSNLIYEATTDEDRKRLWNQREIWDKLDVASGVDVITEVLNPGEKQKIIDAIDAISGYSDDLDGIVKNS